ncbi:MAG: gliding motility-associated ABC transporter substrate-binding protein GldG [Cytophagales bacterium]|nr:gliding motility-associated ABC transporter substrate-binding protein GldG [Cytophagales bacterium]MDW8385355.1 gliding motility-associated ABC transporter substrate-binding protein GldG [Flammeovirgaceae bacterium]
MNLRKYENILTLSAVVLALILLNMVLSFVHLRWDLTEEKRYTISEATIHLLQKLQSPVQIDVYLAGNINASFKRLQNAIQETLDEFVVFGKKNIRYRFINLDELPSAERKRLQQYLVQKGIQPTHLFDQQDGKKIQKLIFPGAIVSYRNREEGVLLLKGNKAASAQEQLNQSIEGIEYELAQAIHKLTLTQRPKIAFTEGHDELTAEQTVEMRHALADFYEIHQVSLQTPVDTSIKVVIVAQPKKPFSETHRFWLDQYLMQGGNIIFLLDNVQMNLDSIALNGTYAFGYELNLTDMIFKYGVRVNLDLLQDQQAGMLDVVVGNFGDRPNIQKIPFPYYILANQWSKHPITKNLDVVYLRFPTSLDTVKAADIRKTPLLFTSRYSRRKNTPCLVSLNELRMDMKPELYKESYIPVAYLLEGCFKSAFAMQFAPIETGMGDKFVKKGKHAKILVCTDGDLIRQEIDKRSGKLLSLEYETSSRRRLSNKEFILNTLAYMTNERGIIVSRNKEISLRPLDIFKIQNHKRYIQTLAMLLPLSIVGVVAGMMFFIRQYYR